MQVVSDLPTIWNSTDVEYKLEKDNQKRKGYALETTMT